MYRSAALRPGSRIGRYRVESVIGSGGFGITYKARAFRDPDEIVAIKEFFPREYATRSSRKVVFSPSVPQSEFVELVMSFVDEGIKLRDKIKHPNIVDVLDIVPKNDTCYLVMEYIDGVPLERALAAGRLSPTETFQILEQVFSAVEFLHAHGEMHRDLSPNNIMVRYDFITDTHVPVLIDFGASSNGLGEERRESSLVVANLHYAPPEQLSSTGPRVHDRYTDVFALGGIMYRIITGRRPIDAMTRLAALANGGRDPLGVPVPAHDPPLFRPAFLNTVTDCLALDPAQRPQSVAEVLQELRSERDAAYIRLNGIPVSG
ncbi:serine/threonine-protein kinase [Prosthecomicrobium sp. N25]|uniref:serine/threonine-protein kinase n=1 Tax=Prosthecomicrobium sp. N25 TaxID=3129254 RepID=UPI0030783E31